ncbi:hypothetical protein [Lacticaseibacillus kribbianus]|uniref:hypothetical protein n=1 Tax=Lacticaseibacillus kribbianus TaxID=2926292 RepID=UPI001CD27E0A|nr:hypothetical protein [Lacticaseibacillus kribbianus]
MRRWVLFLLIGLAVALGGCANAQACTSKKAALRTAAKRLQARHKQPFRLVKGVAVRYRGGQKGQLQAVFAPIEAPHRRTAVTLKAGGGFSDDYDKYHVLPAFRREMRARLAGLRAARGAKFDLSGQTALTLPAGINLDDYLDTVRPQPVVTLHTTAGAAQVAAVYRKLCGRLPGFRLRVVANHRRRLSVTHTLRAKHWLTTAEIAARLD